MDVPATWEYITADVERGLTPGNDVCVRGTVSGRTNKGLLTLEKPSLAPLVEPGVATVVVATYPKKGEMQVNHWPDVQVG